MKALVIFAAVSVFAGATTLTAADAKAIDVVKDAAHKLAVAGNYSWNVTYDDAHQFAGPMSGRAEKGGYACLDFPAQNNGNEMEAVLKDSQGAISTKQGWELMDEWKWLEAIPDKSLEASVRSWMMEWHFHLYKLPATEAQNLAFHVQNLTGSDGVYSGMVPFRGDVKCSVRFWIKDGVLTQYQVHYKGRQKGFDHLISDTDIDQTTTVAIKDVGTTKITVPNAVRDKLA